MAKDNQAFWSSEKRAQGYSARSHLYPAESRFIAEYGEMMRSWRMLDLGIGGGRSTIHFAPLVADYVGTEYAKTMLDECETRFKDWDPALDLRLVDARDLAMFVDACFDLVLFSFNGLDEVDHSGRLAALAEIHRVLKPGGLFLFSSHNLLSADRLFRFAFTKHPLRLLRNMRNFVKIRVANKPLGDRRTLRGHALVHDYAFDWTKFTYYVEPDEQLRQLEHCGFAGGELYVADTPRNAGESSAQEAWLHYLARA